MTNHFYIFCVLFLLVFSCRSGKKAAEDDPAVMKCKREAIFSYEQAENYFYKKEYHLAKDYFSKALTYDCMEGIKIKGYFQKKKILFKDLINQRIANIDTIGHREWREKKKNCARILKEGDTLFARGYYEESEWCYRNYLKDCYPGKEKDEINSKILMADSLANVKDSLEKVRICSNILRIADDFYKQKEFEQALKYIGFYQKNHACPIQDTNKIFFKILALDSLGKVGKE